MGTITKALSLLNHFSVARPEIGLSEFRRLSGQDKATVHRHLTELHSMGYLEQDPESRRYRIGPAILRLSGVREETFPVRRAIAATVDALAEDLGELVLVSLIQGHVVSPAYHKDAQAHGTRVVYDTSETRPLHASASGIVALSFGPPGLLDAYLETPLTRFNSRTVTDSDALRAWVAQTRSQGYARSDQSCEDEVNSFSMPIYDRNGVVNAAVSVAVPASRMTGDKQAAILAALAVASRTLTQNTGGRHPMALRNAS